jgi:hypothetical protein
VERLTVGEAAERLKISEQAVRKRVQRGTLPNSKQDGRVYVYLDSETSTVGHVSTAEVDNPVSPLSSMPRDDDEAVTTAEQGENTKIKEWWQTRLGKLVAAGIVAVLVLGLAGIIFSWRWALIAALVLAAGIPLWLAVWGMALGVYDIATGGDDEVLISEAETSSEQATEISKLCFEYFKHFTTITTAAVLVELALYQQLGLSRASAILGVGTLGVTLWLCIRGLVRLSVGTATSGNFLPIDRWMKRRMVSTAWFFLLGVVTFALAAVNATAANNTSHFLYELARAMAQSIR